MPGPMEIFLNQFAGYSSGDFLQFINAVVARVNLDAALTAAERNVHDGTFVRHQCQAMTSSLVYLIAETDTAFARSFVLAVLYPVSFDNFNGPAIFLRGTSFDKHCYRL